MNKKKDKSGPEKGQKKYNPRVVVKFEDGIGLPYDETAASAIEEMELGSWKELQEKFKGITLRPSLPAKNPEEILKRVNKAKEMDPTYEPPDFLSYFSVAIPEGVEPEEVAKIISGWGKVEAAYVESPPAKPPLVNRAANPRGANQGYLDPAPIGIDAVYAWNKSGGDGYRQDLVDIEQGWKLNHEDLVDHGITMISGINAAYFDHGTSVLGAIAAVDNKIGCVGIAPNINSVRCAGQYFSDGTYSTAWAIYYATEFMKSGDVLLLEAQANIYGYSGVPVEMDPIVYEQIRYATAIGIVVVEPAGNGGLNLDAVVNPWPEWGNVFNRASADFLDSGAIIVGAGTSTDPHQPLGLSCYGSRIDCFSWGEYVDTLSTNNSGTTTDSYTNSFSGTSSASAIIAGAALVVQGLKQAKSGYRYNGLQVREVLSNPVYGATLSQNPSTDRIGVMPNLRTIIESGVI